MKVKSVAVNLSLGIFGTLLGINFPQNFEFNSQRILAQEVSAACPLPADIAVTFLESKCQEVKLEKPQDFYRYYGKDVSKYGRYLTKDQYQTNVEAIKKLALNQTWGNPADMKVTVTLPAGTTVYQGIAAPQNPASCYPGGGQQTFIQDSRDPNIKWSEGQKMVVETFSCP